MIQAQSSTVIQRTVEEVFHYIGPEFFTNYPRWSPEVLRVAQTSRGPVGLGATGHQIRQDHGRRTESSFRVVGFSPGRRLVFQGTSRPRFRVSYELESQSSATRLTFLFELRIELFLRPFEGMIRDAVGRGAQRVCHNLRQLLESCPESHHQSGVRVAAAGTR